MNETRFCEHCGATLAADTRFCEACGRAVSAPSAPPMSEVAAPSSAEPRPSQRRWLIAGCVAAVVLIACVAVIAVGGFFAFQTTAKVPATPTLFVSVPQVTALPPVNITLPPLTRTQPELPTLVATPVVPVDIATPTPSLTPAMRVPTPIAPPPTVAPATPPLPTVPPTPAVPPGLYVSALRLDPDPRRGVDIAFYPTFLNTTGGAQSNRVRVYLYRAENLRNSFGETSVGSIAIPVGSTEQRVAGSWKLGSGGCEDFIARVGWLDEQNRITFFSTPEGGTFELRFPMCQ